MTQITLSAITRPVVSWPSENNNKRNTDYDGVSPNQGIAVCRFKKNVEASAEDLHGGNQSMGNLKTGRVSGLMRSGLAASIVVSAFAAGIAQASPADSGLAGSQAIEDHGQWNIADHRAVTGRIHKIIPDQIIVKFKAGAASGKTGGAVPADAAMKDAAARFGVAFKPLRKLATGAQLYRVSGASKPDLAGIARAIAANP
ncbi:MAG: hypothetical protein PVI37_05955, partial [Gammaproteobacteria bacterium]